MFSSFQLYQAQLSSGKFYQFTDVTHKYTKSIHAGIFQSRFLGLPPVFGAFGPVLGHSALF